MIGNDIVDLQFARKESNWQRPRFLEKIFTEEERHFIHTANDKEVAVWLLWSGKESVYKIIARLEKRRFFAPKKIKHDFRPIRRDRACPVPTNVVHTIPAGLKPCAFAKKMTASQKRWVSTHCLLYKEYIFSTQSVVTDTHIHTIAQLNNNNQSPITNHFHIKKNNYQTQHETTHRHLLKNYAAITDLAADELTIQKDEYQIPHVYYQDEKQSVMISMSHHGHYGAYAIMMDDK